MSSVIKTSDLTKKYHHTVSVNHISLNVEKGSVYGFIGPNGAGKSTTMKMLLGLIRPTSGAIEILGTSLNSNNRLSILKQTGSLIESPSYYSHLSARENLEIVASLKNVDKKEILEVLEIVHLTKAQNRKVKEFSLGMKQRLGIAQALLGNPKLLLLDEPTNGLDPAGIQEMRELICEMPKIRDITIFISSHLLGEMEQMITHVGIINEGSLLFQDTLGSLKNLGKPAVRMKFMDISRADKILTEINVTHQTFNDELILPLLKDEDMAYVTNALSAGQSGILRICEEHKNLEDIFLKITQKKGASVCSF